MVIFILLKIITRAEKSVHELSAMIHNGHIETAGFGSGDLAYMAGEFLELVKRYKQSNSDIQRLSKSVIDTVLEMSELSSRMLNANNAVSRGAESQAKESDAALNMISSLSENFENVFNSAAITENETIALSAVSAEGNGTVKDSVSKSIKAKEAFGRVSATVSSLKESANSVTHIVTAITDITDRTNLLSLNASIEAARAGDSGRGFAVVADEIRKLSEQSTAATLQIVAIVGTIRKKIEDAAALIEETSGTVEEQTAAVRDAGQSFESIESRIQSVSEQQSIVRHTMSELQITKNRLIEMTDNIAAISQESAAVSQDATSMNIQLSQSTEMIHDLAEKLMKTSETIDERVRKFETVSAVIRRDKIALVTVTPHGNQFNKIMVDNAEKTAVKYDYELFAASPAHQKSDEQIAVIRKAVLEGMKYLILVTSSHEEITPVINDLFEKGIITVCIDSDAPDSKRICYIGTDNLAAGRHMGRLIGKYLSGRGSVIISSPNETWENMKLRLNGIKETLSEYPDIHIAASQTGYSDPSERSEDIIRVMQAHLDFDMIAGINTGFTAAISKVRAKVSLENKKIIGFDNVHENLDAIEHGILDAVVAQRQDLFAERAIKALYDYISGRKVDKIQMLDTFEINRINRKMIIR